MTEITLTTNDVLEISVEPDGDGQVKLSRGMQVWQVNSNNETFLEHAESEAEAVNKPNHKVVVTVGTSNITKIKSEVTVSQA